MATLTVYPDPDPETTSVDGYAAQNYNTGSGADWVTIRAGIGNDASDTTDALDVCRVTGDNVENQWIRLRRSIFLFDTSSLPDDADIISAVFSLYGFDKTDALSITPNVSVYTSAPASNTAVVVGDFDSLGSVAQADSPITYAGWSTSAYNDFTLNTVGKGNISKTDVTKFGTRNQNYDVTGTTPAWVSLQASYLISYSAETANTTYDPKLVVTYTTSSLKTLNDLAIASVKTINGLAIASVKTWNGLA